MPKANASAPKAATSKSTPLAPATTNLFVSATEVPEALRVLYWGREGAAKTTQALTLANRGRVLLINAEGGLKVKALRRQGVNTDNIAVYPAPGEVITHAGLNQVYYAIKQDLAEDPKSWLGVIFDSITDVTQGLVDQVSDDRVAKARAKDKEIDEFDAFQTDRNDFGTMTKMARDIIRKFRDLPIHTIYTALERRDVDEKTSKVTYGPAVSPAVATDLLGYSDLVIHCLAPDEDRDYFRGGFKGTGAYRSKDRFGIYPNVMVEPTMDRILDYYDEVLTPDTDPKQEAIRQAAAAEAAKPKAQRTRRARGKAAQAADETSGDESDAGDGQ